MGQTLAQVVTLAEAQGGDAAKQHLGPGDDGEGLAVYAVYDADDGPHALVDSPVEVQAEVDADNDLGEHLEVDPVAEVGMDVGGEELAAAVHVAQGVSEEGEDGGQGLDGDVPPALGYLPGSRPAVSLVIPRHPGSRTRACSSRQGGGEERGRLTPSTMPRGNSTPKASILTKM